MRAEDIGQVWATGQLAISPALQKCKQICYPNLYLGSICYPNLYLGSIYYPNLYLGSICYPSQH